MPGSLDEDEVEELANVTTLTNDDRVKAIMERLGSVQRSSWDEVRKALGSLAGAGFSDLVWERVMRASAVKLNFWDDDAALIASCCEVLKKELGHERPSREPSEASLKDQDEAAHMLKRLQDSRGSSKSSADSTAKSFGSPSPTFHMRCDTEVSIDTMQVPRAASKDSLDSGALSSSTSLAFQHRISDARVATGILEKSKAASKKEDLILQDASASRLMQFKFTIFLFVFVQMAFFATYQFFFETPKTWELVGLPIPVARGFAYGACFWTGVLFLTMSRDFMSLLARCACVQRSQLIMQLINCHKELHVFSAWQVLLDSLVHTVMHHIGTFPALQRNTAKELNEVLACAGDSAGGNFLAIFQYPACPLPDADIGYFAGVLSTPGITGYLLMVVIFLLGWFSRAKERRAHFRVFYALHHILVPAWVILLVLHSANGWVGLGFPLVILVAGIPIAAYTWTRSRRAYLACCCPSTLLEAEKSVNGKLVRIEVQLSRGYRKCKVGEYAYMNIPSFSRFEWHPFTISNSKDDGNGGQLITFCIMCVGSWTKKLHQNCAAGPFPRINIDGPFYAPTVSMPLRSTVVGIGAGVGVTPFLSFLGSLAGSQEHRKNAHVFWMSSYATDFLLFKDLLFQLENQGSGNTKCHLHATRGGWDGKGLGCLFDLATRELWNDWMRRLAAKSTETVPTFCHYPKPLHAIVSGSMLGSQKPLAIVMGRPDFIAELLAIGQADPRENVFVYFCGNDLIKSTIQTACVACNKHNESSGCTQRFYFYHERFD